MTSTRHLICCLLLSTLVAASWSYKILVYSQKNGRSQVIYMGAIADILVEAGHDVTVLYNEINPDVSVIGTKKAKTISIPSVEHVMKHFHGDEYIAEAWTLDISNPIAQASMANEYGNVISAQCENVVANHSHVFQQLRNEKFDIMLHELMDYCQLGIMQAAGIKANVAFQSAIILEGVADQIGVSSNPSLIPSFFATAGEEMTFLERLTNAIQMKVCKDYLSIMVTREEAAFRKYMGTDFIPFQDLIDATTYVITNSDPFLDFPRPIISKVLDLGGLGVKKPNPLNTEWQKILKKRDKSVFISFGSIMKSYTMPTNMKYAFAQTFRAFPNVTFVWKYEKDDTEFLHGIENVHVSPWCPQNDILNHPNLNGFLTHGGMNSVLEAAHRGVPVIVVPLFADQMRNSKMMERVGSGIDFSRLDLQYPHKLSHAIDEILHNDKFAKAAQRVATLIENRPIDLKHTFLKHIEFSARFGPVPTMTSLAPKTSFIAFFMLDVIAFGALLLVVLLIVLYIIVRAVLRLICRATSKKKKTE